MLNGFGGPDRLEMQTVDALPEPSGADVRIRVLMTSAAFTDVMIRKALYPDVKEKPPFTPGYDMVGVVDAAGPEATRFKPGDRVADHHHRRLCRIHLLARGTADDGAET